VTRVQCCVFYLNSRGMKIILVPYRDRIEHKTFFLNYLDKVVDDYRVFFVHQCDNRPFNRGAMKNIGFLAVKALYPDYKNVTLVFNDVDIMPYTKGVFAYDTVPGVIKHNYGYPTCLSASFAIKAGDFEAINGFPNLWEWGLEDTLIQHRALKAKLVIDRRQFHPVGSRKVLQLFDGMERMVAVRGEAATAAAHQNDGLRTLTCRYEIEGNMIQVRHFEVPHAPVATVTKNIQMLGVNLK
jgi:hypothetical protein